MSKIVNLHNDIALALAAKNVDWETTRLTCLVAPVGIEVPMENFISFGLKEVLDEKFPSNNKLEVGLGRDISGDPILFH